MSPADETARERIIQATLALLEQIDDPAQITVRQIAERAEVGVGSINYHFGSKEALLSEAVGAVLMVEAQKHFAVAGQDDADPVTRLRRLLKATSQISVKYLTSLQFLLGYGFQQGDVSVPVMILPLLRDIFGEDTNDLRLRMMALQIIIPLQFVALNPAALRQYTGYDLLDAMQRDRLIDQLIDNVLPHQGD